MCVWVGVSVFVCLHVCVCTLGLMWVGVVGMWVDVWWSVWVCDLSRDNKYLIFMFRHERQRRGKATGYDRSPT